MNTILQVGLAILAGLLLTRVAKKLGLPAVTAYLVTGLLIGPYCLGRLGIGGLGFKSMKNVEQMGIISDIALGFIAFSIGSEFRLSALKEIGRAATVIGIVQGLVAAAFVDAALIVMHLILPDVLSVSAAITLGAIATATAPAATLMVVRQYKASGKLTDILLPVVALDDAVGLVVFSVSFGIAKALSAGSFDVVSILAEPIIEIVASLLLGTVLGWVLTKLETLFNSNSNRLSLSIGMVIFTVAVSLCKFTVAGIRIGFSSLLVCMMMSTVFCNLCPLSQDIMTRCDSWTTPLFALFFVISGAELELNVLTDIAVIGVGFVYILFRSLGKYIGAYGSCRATDCSAPVTRYLGITLLPQAGVALGMVVTVISSGVLGPKDTSLIRNIILFSVLIYELVGPACTKWALTKAGDIRPKSEEVLNRRQIKLENARNHPSSRR